MNIDKLNWAILESLQDNARLSFSEIGRKVGLSSPAVAERVKKMEDAGIIKGYKTEVSYQKKLPKQLRSKKNPIFKRKSF